MDERGRERKRPHRDRKAPNKLTDSSQPPPTKTRRQAKKGRQPKDTPHGSAIEPSAQPITADHTNSAANQLSQIFQQALESTLRSAGLFPPQTQGTPPEPVPSTSGQSAPFDATPSMLAPPGPPCNTVNHPATVSIPVQPHLHPASPQSAAGHPGLHLENQAANPGPGVLNPGGTLPGQSFPADAHLTAVPFDTRQVGAPAVPAATLGGGPAATSSPPGFRSDNTQSGLPIQAPATASHLPAVPFDTRQVGAPASPAVTLSAGPAISSSPGVRADTTESVFPIQPPATASHLPGLPLDTRQVRAPAPPAAPYGVRPDPFTANGLPLSQASPINHPQLSQQPLPVGPQAAAPFGAQPPEAYYTATPQQPQRSLNNQDHNTGTYNMITLGKPLDAQTDPKIKQKIWQQEYINLFLLIKPVDCDNDPQTLGLDSEGHVAVQHAPWGRIGSIVQWHEAWRIYMYIALQNPTLADTQKADLALAMIQNMHHINHLHSRRADFLFYDTNFRQYLQYNPTPFSAVDHCLVTEAQWRGQPMPTTPLHTLHSANAPPCPVPLPLPSLAHPTSRRLTLNLGDTKYQLVTVMCAWQPCHVMRASALINTFVHGAMPGIQPTVAHKLLNTVPKIRHEAGGFNPWWALFLPISLQLNTALCALAINIDNHLGQPTA